MKKNSIFSIIIIFLIFVDQLSKLLVHLFIDITDEMLMVSNTVHIHPWFNEDQGWLFNYIYDNIANDIFIVTCIESFVVVFLCVQLFFLIYLFHQFLFWNAEIKSYKILTGVCFSFLISGMICSKIFDAFIWKKTLDYICIVREVVRVCPTCHKTHPVPWHWFHFDLKDIYLLIGFLLFIVRIALWIVEFSKYEKKHKKDLNNKFRHPIQNIKNMKNRCNF